MKKILILLMSLVIIMPNAFSATYKIKNGNVISPTGRTQVNTTVSTPAPAQRTNSSTYNNTATYNNNNYNPSYNTATYNNNKYQNNNNDEEVIFTKANEETPQSEKKNPVQTVVNKITPEPSNQKIETLKTENKDYLKEPDTNLMKSQLTAIQTKYHRDPRAEEHKNAIKNRQLSTKDCLISTFSSSKHYSIWCKEDQDHAYYYNSTSDPTLFRVDIIKRVDNNRKVSYVYFLEGDRWYFTAIHIDVDRKYTFLYDKTPSGFILQYYYIGDVCYDVDGKYRLTRTTRKL